MPTAGSTRPVRVLLAGLPGMLCSIIRETLAPQPDLRVVGLGDDWNGALDEPDADVILVPITILSPTELANKTPSATSGATRIIGITPEGRHVAVLHADLSPQDLVHTIRAAASQRGETYARTEPTGTAPPDEV